jgi:NTP pyrophosphatase (non-canonical NTP hydrolase)
VSRREKPTSIANLRARLKEFTRMRDWEQFHTPKNLAISLAVEAAELLEIFQWLTDAEAPRIVESKSDMNRMREEIADIYIYLIRLADVLGIDLGRAALAKIEKNTRRYPVRLSRANAVKYSTRA